MSIWQIPWSRPGTAHSVEYAAISAAFWPLAQYPDTQPAAQLHENSLMGTDVSVADSMHVAPFRHGDDAHSSKSIEHVAPDHPTAHWHM